MRADGGMHNCGRGCFYISSSLCKANHQACMVGVIHFFASPHGTTFYCLGRSVQKKEACGLSCCFFPPSFPFLSLATVAHGLKSSAYNKAHYQTGLRAVSYELQLLKQRSGTCFVSSISQKQNIQTTGCCSNLYPRPFSSKK